MGLFSVSCNDWTEMESVTQKTQRPNEQDPELWAQYTAALREYKQSEHTLVPTALPLPRAKRTACVAFPTRWM